MTNLQALLDRAREMCTPPTLYELARRLRVSYQIVYRVYKDGGGMSNEACFRLAKMLGMDASTVIAYMEEDRAPVTRKEFWRSQLPRLLAAFGLAATLAVGPSPRSVEAATPVVQIDHGIHYAHLLIRRILRNLRNKMGASMRPGGTTLPALVPDASVTPAR